MRNIRIPLTSILFTILAIVSPATAQPVTPVEAATVAHNWITLIIEKEGSWGGAESASLNELYDLKQGDRLLGYLFRIQPQGYIVVSLYKELPPVQVYSDTGDFDPESDTQGEGIIEEQMARLLDNVEGLTRPQLSIQSQALLGSSQDGKRPAWETLRYDSGAFAEALQSGILAVAYEPGKVLLTSSWRQGHPYNQKCPEPFFPIQVAECNQARCLVGCTPLAGAQIMRYWAWPPGYDWANMPDMLGDSNSPPAQIDAVATLCADVGDKANAAYCVPGWGCETLCSLIDIPGVQGDLMEALVEDLAYHPDADADVLWFESDAEWFGYFKKELNENRPVPYELGTAFHTVVCDGWREIGGMKQLHLNYGWGGKHDGWWTLDTAPNRGALMENIIRGLRPAPSMGSALTGFYERDGEFPYRYFDQDAMGLYGAIFDAGQNLQFLPGVKLTSTQLIQFHGTGSRPTRLFSIKGTKDGGLLGGIKLSNGVIQLHHNGSIRFH